ncbi:hypothetical protein K458DRAFT_137828 [Lentithecium fluviatile CBS 122367]|uniref:Uncharacterized protein n=1 Tax=Lentithecium fluviatile CBS 122367 TaxID=1168545 RepID=A0A6G1IJP6_9PLEO|nr:hypothetical protein K458DRAFT_137828 [Lentithecium fluviatile CBS 122367]
MSAVILPRKAPSPHPRPTSSQTSCSWPAGAKGDIVCSLLKVLRCSRRKCIRKRILEKQSMSWLQPSGEPAEIYDRVIQINRRGSKFRCWRADGMAVSRFAPLLASRRLRASCVGSWKDARACALSSEAGRVRKTAWVTYWPILMGRGGYGRGNMEICRATWINARSLPIAHQHHSRMQRSAPRCTIEQHRLVCRECNWLWRRASGLFDRGAVAVESVPI